VSTTEAVAKVIVAQAITSATATIIAAASKCAGGEPGTPENKGNCKNDQGFAQHDDLFEMLPASGSIQYPLSIGCPQVSLRSTLEIYERALVIACPILLRFAHHCGISAERSATYQLRAGRK